MANENVNEVDMQHVDEQPDAEDRRIVLTIHARTFVPSESVTTSITTIWKSHFTGEWDTWTSIPQVEKDIWFDAFKGQYKWDTRINTDVRRLFNVVGSKSFRDFMCKARKKPSSQKPPFLNPNAWQTMCRRWRLPEFVAKSERGKRARQANKRLHTGGSISNVEHKRRLRKEYGRDPSAAELFIRTHKRKDDTFVNDEAKETWERYNEKYGTNDSTDVQSGNVSNSYPRWVEHVGLKNGRDYGLGSGVDKYILQRNEINELSSNTSHNVDLLQIREMMEQQRDEQQRQKTEQEHLIAEYDRLKATQELQTQKLNQVVQSQSSLEENLRNIFKHEVDGLRATQEAQTKKLLDALQYRP